MGSGKICTKDFDSFRKRIRRRFYYSRGKHGQKDGYDTLTLPLSNVALEYFDKRSPFDYLDESFAMRLAREGCVDPCCFLLGIMYLEKMRTNDMDTFDSTDPADLYLTALVLASKYLYDAGEEEYVYNDEWAASADMDIKRLNRLEIHFLKAIDWNISVKRDAFERMLEKIETTVAISESSKRSWLSYTEGDVLLTALLNHDPTRLTEMLNTLIKVISGLLMTYVGFTLGIVGMTSYAMTTSPSSSTTTTCGPSATPSSTLDVYRDSRQHATSSGGGTDMGRFGTDMDPWDQEDDTKVEQRCGAGKEKWWNHQDSPAVDLTRDIIRESLKLYRASFLDHKPLRDRFRGPGPELAGFNYLDPTAARIDLENIDCRHNVTVLGGLMGY